MIKQQEYTPEDLTSLVTSQDKILLYIYGDACGPCKQFWPSVVSLCAKLYIPLYPINGPEYRDFSLGLGIKRVPTTILVKDGSIQDKFTGVLSLTQLEDFVSQ